MHIHNEQEMQNFAVDILKALSTSNRGANVLALHGELGAGKSTFVRTLAHELGVQEHVISPTFNILKTYQCPRSFLGHTQLVHIDAYRLEVAHELSALGWEELVTNPENIICIEWPENVEKALPEDVVHIKFDYIDEQTRSVELCN